MDLERVGKHDEDNNGGLANGGEDGWGICARLANEEWAVGCCLHIATTLPPTAFPKER